MNAQSNELPSGLSDLAYDLITIMQNKAKGIRAYETYLSDAQKQSASGCSELIKRIHEDDLRHVTELKQHLVKVLGNGQSAGGQQQGSQSESQSGSRAGSGSAGGAGR